MKRQPTRILILVIILVIIICFILLRADRMMEEIDHKMPAIGFINFRVAMGLMGLGLLTTVKKPRFGFPGKEIKALRKLFLTVAGILMLTFFSHEVNAQVTVAGSGGFANGTYPTLKNAFDALNAVSTQAGNTITISITASITDNNSAVLNQPSVSSWTSLTISPSGGAWTLSGSVNSPLIDLNGADNVTINGLNSGGNALTISNTSTSSTTGTSTIRMINDASNNTITNCTILGSSVTNAAQSGSNTVPTTATIIIGGSNGTTGNDNNTISQNTIAEAGTNLPTVSICSAGQSVSIANDLCVITGNRIANFYNTNGANGIAIASNSSAFTITSNKFYQTAARTGLNPSLYLECIFINTPSGGGYQVNNNILGYASHDGTGMLTSSNGRFAGIDLTSVAATPVSEIQGNTINGVNWTSSYNTFNAYSNAAFYPVIVRAGGVNIGTSAGNTIGAQTGTGSTTSNIYLLNSATGFSATMIYVNSSNPCTISNNHIGAITAGLNSIYLYGIVVEGTASYSILSNEIGNVDANNISFGINTFGAFTGIYCLATGNEIIGANGQGNIVQNITFSYPTSHDFDGITAGNNPLSLNINHNTIQGIVFAGTGSFSPSFSGILNAGTPVNSLNMNNNHLGTASIGLVSFLTSGNTNGNFLGIISGGLAPAAPLSISNNDIRGITHNGTSGSGHLYISWTHSGSVTDNINNNTFTNLNIKSGGVTFLDRSGNMATGAVENVNGNAIVGGFTKTSGNGQIYFLSTNGQAASGTTVNNQSNDFSNITILDQTIILGWKNNIGISGSFVPQKNITGNTFNNLTGIATTNVNHMLRVEYYGAGSVISGNSIQNISCGGGITGMWCDQSGTYTGSSDISLNKVGGLNSTGSVAVTGMYIRTNNATITKNKIFDLSAGGFSSIVRGLNIDGSYSNGVTQTISNNYIGNLVAPLATNSNGVIGIYLNSFSTVTYNVYYNTIFLASFGGSGFGSSGIYHATSTTATTGLLNLRNNIVINLSTPQASGLTVAFRRSGGNANELNNYASTSNNNFFYAGTPSASRLIYYDGVSSAATMAAFRGGVFTAGTIAPRDAQSVSETVVPANFFLSTTGTDAGFLHINASNPTLIEGRAVTIPTFTDDYDGDVRNISTPDIGADEGPFTANTADLTGPVITYTPIVNGIVAISQSFSNVVITDVSNVEGTAGIRPRVYYKRSTDTNVFNDNTNATAGWKYVEASGSTSPFNFTLNYTLLSGGTGLSVGNTVQYFVVAQDQAAIPNVGIKAGVFNLDPSSVALTSAAFPIVGTINSFPILQSISGTITVPGTYPSLTGAGGAFAVINANVVTGNINIELTANSGAEHGLNGLNEFAAPYTIKIYPTGTARFLAGIANSGGIIKLNGADRVIIDGSIGGTGTDRSLTFSNSSTSFPSVMVINSLGTGAGATQNSIRNCNVTINNPNHSSYGISIGGSTPGTIGADNDDVTIQNNNITNVSTAIYANGTTAASTGGNDNLQILNNTILTYTGAPECNGIRVGNSLNSLLKGNMIDIASSNTVYPVGISLESGCLSSQITSNLITGVRAYINTYGARGISIGTGSVNSDLTIANNVIYSVFGQDNSDITKSSMGICIGLLGSTQTTITTGGIKLYYNSINLYNSSGAANTITTALYTGIATGNLDIRNNIFGNSNTGSNSTIKNYAIYSAALNTAFANINNNDYYSNNPNNQTTSIPGFIGSDRIDLAAIQAGFGQNVNSIILSPSFFANNDLRPTSGSVLGAANSAGTGITVDYLNVTRSTGTPPNGSTMGAYENAFDNSAPVILYTSLPSTCSTGDRLLTATITDVSGVPVTGTLMPRIYFKKNAGSFFSSPGVLASGTGMNGTWTFTIPAATLGGIVPGDVISYFVIAQDNSMPIKISSNPSSGLVATDVNTITTPPTTPNSYAISFTLGTGNYSVGTTTLSGELGHFATITAAIQAYNTACLTGAPVFVLTEMTYGGGETFPITISQNIQASNVNVLTIKPTIGVTPVISGSASTALIDVVGGDYVIIDGSNNGTNTKNLTISNTNTSGSVIRFTNDATNITVKNSILNGVNASATSAILYLGGTNLSTGNDFIVIQNNDITSGSTANAYGIYNSGNTGSSTLKNSDIQVTGNNIYNFSRAGIYDNGGSVGTVYQNNKIYGVDIQSAAEIYGYRCNSNTIEGFAFRNNRIYDMKVTPNSGLMGIYIEAISTGPLKFGEITNNMISIPATNNTGVYGIVINSATGTILKINYNSININGFSSGTSAAIYRNGTSTIEVKNNILANTKTNSGFDFTLFFASGSVTNFTSDYNELYSSPNIALVNHQGFYLYTLSNWKSAFNQDLHSVSVVPAFVSIADLHLATNGNCTLENAGISIAGYTTDFDNDTRSATPDIGADEFTAVPLTGYTAGTDQNVCATSTQMAPISLPFSATGTWSVVTGQGFFSPNVNTPTATVSGLLTGINTFKWTVNYGSCTMNSNMNITLNSPAISQCPNNIITSASLATCTAVANYMVSATGLPTPTFSYDFNGATIGGGSGTGSGSQFNIGATVVNIFASNGCGPAAICSFVVEVRAPEINVSGNNSTIADGQIIPVITNHTNFDTVMISTIRTRTFTINNSGDNDLNLTDISITGTDASKFTFTPPLVSILTPGSSTTFTVTFSPTSIGFKTATIHIGNNDCNETDFDFVVKGYGHNIYHFVGSGDWTETVKWHPSYPGLTLPAGLEAYADNSESINIPANIKITINGTLNIPFYVNSLGDITIGGQGSITCSYMDLSDTLLIQAGGQFNVNDGGFYIYNYGVGALLNHGTATISNCEITNESSIYNYPGATFISNYSLNNYALFENHGIFIANGVMAGQIQNMSDGTMKIAEPNQCLFNWDLLTTQGTFELDIDGTTNDCMHFDKMNGPGWLELGGTLKLNINYTPSNNDAITILETGPTTNQFAVLDAPAGWTILYNNPSPNKVTVKFNCANTVITSQPLATQTICQNTPPSTLSVGATGTGLQYQWYVDNDNIGFNGTLIMSATSSTYIPPTTVAGTNYYYAKVTGACGVLNTTYAEVKVNATGRWLGTVSADWHTASNWCGGVPVVTTEVLIAPAPFHPIVSTANAICKKLTVLPTGLLDINAPRTLMVKEQ